MRCSLIIPAYNAEATIATCIESALAQSLPKEDYEVIVVDDGSLDATRTVASSYPIAVMSQANEGPAVARNRGAQQARTNILVFTDSDCELDQKFLETIIAPIEQSKDIAGVQGSYKSRQTEFIARFGQIEIVRRYERMRKNPYIDHIGTYAAAYRADVFKQFGGFDTGFPLASGEDMEFSYALQRNGYKMVFEPRAFVYHQHPTALKQYLKSKFYRGYWRMRLYRKHPTKTLADSYTPQSLKLQVLSIALMSVCAILAVFNGGWLIPCTVIIFSFWLYAVPFVRRFESQRGSYHIIIPAVLFLRAIALLGGMVGGFINEVRMGKHHI